MRRRLIALFGIVVVLACLGRDAAAQAPPPSAESTKLKVVDGKDGVGYEMDGGSTVGAAGSSQAGTTGANKAKSTSAKAKLPSPPMYKAYKPVLKKGPDGATCVGAQKVWFESQAQATFVDEQQDPEWLRLANIYPYCPGVVRPGDTSPGGVAVDYWREAGTELLPKPQPQIRPGWMLVAKRGYLEANVDLAPTYRVPTRLGELRIDAVGRMFVDWGDGARDGPFAQRGAPWPDGTITHYWTTAGFYDVAVTVRWTATWRLGRESGVLEDLETQGVLDDFEIDGLEAVRNR